MNEEFLNYLWTNQLFSMERTSFGEEISILHPGQRNTNSGPDFFNSRIKIGSTIWAGNVEIHVHSSDWFKHNHHKDPAYDNIILHVVFEDDKPIHRKNNEPIPTIILKHNFDVGIYEKYQGFIHSKKWIACEDLIHSVNHFEQLSWFDTLMAERLEDKANAVQSELNLSDNDFHEVFYRKLARNFGFSTNADAFESLANVLPLKLLGKYNNSLKQIEALLFGQAGLLTKDYTDEYTEQLYKEYLFLSEKHQLKPIKLSSWKFMRMHPANFPTIRISQFANIIHRSSGLLHKILETEKLSDVISLFKTQTSSYWTTHYRFGKTTKLKVKSLGKSSIDLLLINTIIPFAFVYGKQTASELIQDKAIRWLEQIKPERNYITRHFKERGVQCQNAMHSQALIQLKKKYCDQKRCLECRIGYLLLNT